MSVGFCLEGESGGCFGLWREFLEGFDFVVVVGGVPATIEVVQCERGTEGTASDSVELDVAFIVILIVVSVEVSKHSCSPFLFFFLTCFLGAEGPFM